jgi:hypothetical protein
MALWRLGVYTDPAMNKCVNCHGTLTATEATCIQCGTVVPPIDPPVTLQERFRTGVRIGFILSALLTVASLFTDYTPSFTKCAVATVILFLVKGSADGMWENR